MKTLTITLSLSLAFGVAAFADTTDELKLISGSNTLIVTDNGAGDFNPSNGTISYGNTDFNGWDISVTSGTSRSPGLSPFGLDLTSLTATCEGAGAASTDGAASPCASDPLQIWFSDIDFNVHVPANDFMTTFSSTQTGGGSVSETSWFAMTNVIFGQARLIGTVGPLTSSGGGSATGGPVATTEPYSLTMEEVFNANGSNPVSFSVDGNVTAVPEPGAIVLFGTVLMLCAIGFRRRKLTR